jgi:hypothetical protein
VKELHRKGLISVPDAETVLRGIKDPKEEKPAQKVKEPEDKAAK